MANPNPKTDHLEATKWKKGDIPNPKGSSKKQRLTLALIKLIEEKGLEDPFVRSGMTQALKGDFNFWKYIYERVDGKMEGSNIENPEESAAVDESGNPVDP